MDATVTSAPALSSRVDCCFHKRYARKCSLAPCAHGSNTCSVHCFSNKSRPPLSSYPAPSHRAAIASYEASCQFLTRCSVLLLFHPFSNRSVLRALKMALALPSHVFVHQRVNELDIVDSRTHVSHCKKTIHNEHNVGARLTIYEASPAIMPIGNMGGVGIKCG